MSVIKTGEVLTNHFKSVGYTQIIDKDFDPLTETLCNVNSVPGYTQPDTTGQTGEVPVTHYSGDEIGGQNTFDFMRTFANGLSGTPEADTLNPLYEVTPENAGQPNEWFYEDVTVNALYNVKEWRIAGTVGTFSFDETLQSGQSISVTTSGTTIIRDVPNDGERGVYGFQFQITESVSLGDSYLVNINIYTPSQNTWPERLSGHADSPYASQPWLDAFISFTPYLQAAKTIYIGQIKDQGSPIGAPALTVVPTVTLLGQDLQCYSDDPPTCSISITPETYWTTENWFKA